MLFLTTGISPFKKTDGLGFKNILFPVFAQKVEQKCGGLF